MSPSAAGAVVVVGVKPDCRSKELLTWALVKVANSGDRVIALCIIHPDADRTIILSLVKNFDSLLAAFEGFCNLKQVDLKLKVCRGSPVRNILSREAASCGAASLVLGTSKANTTLRSKTSLAKSCAKSLQNSISVICVDNGKIMFQSESRYKKSKTFSNIPLSLPAQRVSSSSSSANGRISMALVPCKSQEMVARRSGWTLLSRTFLHGSRGFEYATSKKSSVMHWLSKLPSLQSVAAIYPDQKQFSASNMIFSDELGNLQEKYSNKCQLFSYQELSLATNNFIPEYLIGKGGSSQVYKGCLPGSREIAVKILKPSNYVLEHFVSEIEILTSFCHKNIISLVGFCYNEDQLLLVYNLLSRGCLEESLHGCPVSRDQFGWGKRYKIALGVAEALDALHNAAVPIIHRDVKSSNILLSDNFGPQLSDFGLATWKSSCSRDMDTSDVAGTFGYLAPECFMHGELNEKIDVYAFGVVLLELLSGKKAIDNGQPKGQESLVVWAKHILKEGKISELQDPSLGDAYDRNQFENVVLAATLCIRHRAQSRPAINLVLKLLQGDSDVIEWARQDGDIDYMNHEQSATDIQSFINLALLDLEDETAFTSIVGQNVPVED
ncbi:probable serine/threonine-protein kinase PBL22 [Salvia splendens]|uniref:probable serine/threonine-protein kinase PBL22 n=1 Tax=Salvia splendens TaxID=180675 RepID=UPI001102E998|nr:probable serine/threonine-protein kinase PBL22 [Salvia splendens]